TMAAMIAVAFIVNEDDTKVGTRRDGFRQIASVHVGVSAWLEDQRASHLVDIALHPIAPLHDGLAGKARQAAHNNPERLTACMDLDGPDHSLDVHSLSWFEPIRRDGNAGHGLVLVIVSEQASDRRSRLRRPTHPTPTRGLARARPGRH